jgi:hypothetical protein
MKNIKIITVVVLGLALCGAAVPEKSDCQKKAEIFLAGVLKGEIDKSYDEILPEWLKEVKPQEVQMLKAQTKTAVNIYGNLLDYEFIKQQRYGDCIVRIVYVLKSERMPFTWEFYFYKAKKVSNWELVNIKFSDEYDILADK